MNRYKKHQLQEMISDFVKKNDYLKIKKKVLKYKRDGIDCKAKFPLVYEISEEYYEEFKSSFFVFILFPQ